MITFVQKSDDGTYSLMALDLTGKFSLHCLSELSKQDFHCMIEYMEQMRVTKNIPFYYYFPRYKRAPEIDVRLVRNNFGYQVILNLGARILSDMNQAEFDQTLHELKDLVSQFTGHKVYFPPVKDIFKNDK